jgi:hypothetical protein
VRATNAAIVPLGDWRSCKPSAQSAPRAQRAEAIAYQAPQHRRIPCLPSLRRVDAAGRAISERARETGKWDLPLFRCRGAAPVGAYAPRRAPATVSPRRGGGGRRAARSLLAVEVAEVASARRGEVGCLRLRAVGGRKPTGDKASRTWTGPNYMLGLDRSTKGAQKCLNTL